MVDKVAQDFVIYISNKSKLYFCADKQPCITLDNSVYNSLNLLSLCKLSSIDCSSFGFTSVVVENWELVGVISLSIIGTIFLFISSKFSNLVMYIG